MSAEHRRKRERAREREDERQARRHERLPELAPPLPHVAEAFPQAVPRAGYESRLRTVRVGSTPFTLARFMRGQKWALGHRERIQAALDADPRLVRIRGKGHPQWRRVVTGPRAAQSFVPGGIGVGGGASLAGRP